MRLNKAAFLNIYYFYKRMENPRGMRVIQELYDESPKRGKLSTKRELFAEISKRMLALTTSR